jgi:pteridine reductase
VALAEAGADILLHVHSAATEEVIAEIAKLGRHVDVIKMDLSLPQAGEQLAREALQRVGCIDIFVNSAAVFFATPLSQLTVEEWRAVLQVNLSAGMTLAVTLGREMIKREQGKIIQLGDWGGQRPVRHFLPYCVAKGGLHLATAALAKAFAPHVQVNEVVLGPVLPPADYGARALQTLQEHTPLRRLGQPEDVVRLVRFLIQQGDFITGASYTVDGGWLAQSPGGMATTL